MTWANVVKVAWSQPKHRPVVQLDALTAGQHHSYVVSLAPLSANERLEVI
jgi:hypothetical protein